MRGRRVALRALLCLALQAAAGTVQAQSAAAPETAAMGPPTPPPDGLRLSRGDAASAEEIDATAAQLLRHWLAGDAFPGRAMQQTSSTAALQTLEPWLLYIDAMSSTEPGYRDRALGRVGRRNQDPFVHAAMLRAIAIDPSVQSRQAQFFRRYGFYANWFNRLFYSAGRALQGNLSAGLQLGVDAVADLFRPREANEQERRAYALMQRARELRQRRTYDRETLAKLERSVDMAFARADLDQAQWALDQGDAVSASFYAEQALVRRPDWGAASDTRDEAEIAAAAQRRRALASGQAGYPDRTPPVDLVDAEVLRGVLGGDAPTSASAAGAQHAALITLLTELPRPGAGRATMMRDWPDLVDDHRKTAEADARWMLAFAGDPAQNPDLRLNNAIETRRGKQLHYVFLGPERTRERAYKTASWLTQTYNALASIGVFYVFEVAGRAMKVTFGSPVPMEEVIDAEANWLATAGDPTAKGSREIARDLAERYRENDRYEDARAVLERSGELTLSDRRSLKRAEARRLTNVAETLPPGRLRTAYYDRATSLSAEIAARSLKRTTKQDERRRLPAEEYQLSWEGLQRLTRLALPSGLPGSPGWFDGEASNGEINPEGFFIRYRPGDTMANLSYTILQPGADELFYEDIELERLPSALRIWLELGGEQRRGNDQALNQLERVPIPFSIEGGVGASGVDLYPRLLPLGDDHSELYR